MIRRGLVEGDLVECIVVLPSKLFYGNGVPACLLFLNKNKAPERKGKILMIWASRHFQKGNPQNLLRPSDLMRILVPWRAFGDLNNGLELINMQEAQLIREVEENRDQRLNDIEDAYGPVLAPLSEFVAEQEKLDALDLKVKAVNDAVSAEHPYFHPLEQLRAEAQRLADKLKAAASSDKAALKTKIAKQKTEYDTACKKLIAALKQRTRQVYRAVKELKKLQEERDSREQELRQAAEREIAHLHEAGADLRHIFSDPDEARRYFAVADKAEVEENEFNLNLPRYVDTFEPEKVLPLANAIRNLNEAETAAKDTRAALEKIFVNVGIEHT